MRRLSRVTLALILSLSITGVVGCGSSGSSEPAPTDAAEKEEDVVLQEDDVTEFDPDAREEEPEAEEPEAEEVADVAPAEETQHVGADGVGYVDIPASWVEFKDAEGGDDLQWCDGTPYTIITLNVIDLGATLTPEQRETFTTETAANNILAHVIEEGMDQESARGAHVTLAGRDAVQAYGSYPDGSTLVFWIVEDDQGNYRYVSAEGTDDTILDTVGIIEASYQL